MEESDDESFGFRFSTPQDQGKKLHKQDIFE